MIGLIGGLLKSAIYSNIMCGKNAALQKRFKAGKDLIAFGKQPFSLVAYNARMLMSKGTSLIFSGEATGDPEDPGPPPLGETRVVSGSYVPSEDAGSISGLGTYSVGQGVSITVTPAPGYEFVQFTMTAPYGQDPHVITNDNVAFTMPDYDIEIVATFSEI